MMPKTNENVQYAFAGESQANRKYLFFADKAEEEGHKQAARLFRAAAEAETVHARNHLRVIQGIKSTKDNLAAAISGEHHEFTQMYPGFIKEADAEGQTQAKRSFDMANQVEKIHHGLFLAALDNLNKGKAVDDKPFFVCPVCGNTVEGSAPDKCPICGASAKMFKRVD
jgi:rubrerythrin